MKKLFGIIRKKLLIILTAKKKECVPNKKINILSRTVFNIMNNFIPNETILIDDRDSPWISKKIKSLILEKNLGFKKHFKTNNSETRGKFYPV